MRNATEHATNPPNLYKFYFEDGLWEIFYGGFFIVLGVLYIVGNNPTSSYSLILLISLIGLVSIYSFLKEVITVRRVGKKPPEPPLKSNTPRKIFVIISATIAVSGLILIYLNMQGFITWSKIPAFFQFWNETELNLMFPTVSLIISIIMSIKIKKFTIDIVIISTTIGIEILFYLYALDFSGFSILIAGCCLAVIGSIRLRKFLHKYPTT